MFWCTRIKQQPISTWDSSRVLLCASVHRTIKRNFPILKDTPLKRYHQTAYLCFCFSLSSLNLSSFILSVELRRSFSFWARFIFRSCSFLCLISLISATFRIRSSRFLHTTNTAVLPFRAECRNTGVIIHEYDVLKHWSISHDNGVQKHRSTICQNVLKHWSISYDNGVQKYRSIIHDNSLPPLLICFVPPHGIQSAHPFLLSLLLLQQVLLLLLLHVLKRDHKHLCTVEP